MNPNGRSTPVRTYRDEVAAHFRTRPGQWIDGFELARIGGAYAWRTRVSECRVQLGMTIENRQRTVNRRTVSEYRFVPQSPAISAETEGLTSLLGVK